MVARFDLDDSRLPEFHKKSRDALKRVMERKLGRPITKVMRLQRSGQLQLVINVYDPEAMRPTTYVYGEFLSIQCIGKNWRAMASVLVD